MDKIINFFKQMNMYDEHYFNYLKQNTKIIDKPYNEIKEFVGCFKIDNKCRLVLPKINNINDELIYIHEYTHALFLDDELEIFPNIMEAIYINQNITDLNIKNQLIKKTKVEIENTDSFNHKIGKKVKLLSIKI